MRSAADRGAVTAEAALLLPGLLLLVLAICLQSLQLAGLQAVLQDAAGMAARSLARGEAPEPVLRELRTRGPVRLAPLAAADGRLRCLRLEQERRLIGVLPIRLSAEACALAGGL